jgi:hypothetical protein
VIPLTTTICAIVVACGIAPVDDVPYEPVDLIEVNHLYDEQGRLVFDQIIFYDWSPRDSHYMVRAWRLVKSPAQLPKQDFRTGGYTAVWHDGEVLRHVWAQSKRETWTQYDPDLIEREFLPKERRKELSMKAPPSPPRKVSRLVAAASTPRATSEATNP